MGSKKNKALLCVDEDEFDEDQGEFPMECGQYPSLQSHHTQAPYYPQQYPSQQYPSLQSHYTQQTPQSSYYSYQHNDPNNQIFSQNSQNTFENTYCNTYSPQFQESHSSQMMQRGSRGVSRGGSRGGSRGESRGGSRGGRGKAVQSQGRSRTKTSYWTEEEDIALARAFVNISENSITGRDQKGAEFWRQISEMVGENSTTSALRDGKSCQNRMDIIKRKILMWKNATDRCEKKPASGENEHGKFNRIMAAYKTFSGGDEFKLGHVKDILMACGRFSYPTTDGSEGRTPSEPSLSERTPSEDTGGSTPLTAGSTGTKRTFEDLAPVYEEEYTSPLKPIRPIGTKGAKSKKRLFKGSGSGETSDAMVHSLESLKINQDLKREKLDLLKANMELNRFQTYMTFLSTWNEATATEEMRLLKDKATRFVLEYSERFDK